MMESKQEYIGAHDVLVEAHRYAFGIKENVSDVMNEVGKVACGYSDLYTDSELRAIEGGLEAALQDAESLVKHLRSALYRVQGNFRG